jgi:hypothetical protein
MQVMGELCTILRRFALLHDSPPFSSFYSCPGWFSFSSPGSGIFHPNAVKAFDFQIVLVRQ